MRTNLARGIAVGLIAAAMGDLAHAQNTWPSRPIRLISTSVAGGNIDIMCRIIAEKLSVRLGQPVVVDNRPGAATVLGTAEAAKASPDGYTFLITIMSSMVGNRVLRTNLPYDPVKDFEPVTQVSTGSVLLVGPASAPYRDLKGFVEWAQKLGRPVSYGSIGVGTSLHLFGVILEKEYGVPLNHVPYKGEVQATNDVMNGTLDVAWVSILVTKPLVAAGRIRALAITGPKRFVAMPELPTFAEQGFPGFEMPVWGGAYLPAGTPKPIVERLSREIVEVLRMPEVSERLVAMGQLPIGNTPEEFAENYRRDFPRWEALIKASGAKVE
jgi:tripartite-type tricarboxylate transporter receptor subunit TctC